MTLAYLPSPAQGVWYLGPIPVRAYALCILIGIFVAVWITDKRWVARGGRAGQIGEVALWAVPAGIIGARIYHVLTDWSTYFGPGGKGFVAALELWNGGLGIWGAVAGGALGAWYACRRYGLLLPPLGDALAPGLAVAQAIGRWGNWFNQELFGRPTQVPWGLEIDPANRPDGYEQFATFHPTYLYESLWCLAVAFIVWWADRRFRMGHGRVFALYVALYCLGRLFWEILRIDDANLILGIRLNVFTSVIVGVGAVVYILISRKVAPGREASVYRDPQAQAESDEADGTSSTADADSRDDTGEAASGEADVRREVE